MRHPEENANRKPRKTTILDQTQLTFVSVRAKEVGDDVVEVQKCQKVQNSRRRDWQRDAKATFHVNCIPRMGVVFQFYFILQEGIDNY
jgi:flagellar basal body L-ring protein FlgH